MVETIGGAGWWKLNSGDRPILNIMPSSQLGKVEDGEVDSGFKERVP
jgi:hypothetical protein